ncbi:MAG TPA: methyltransferase domain-containing protein [Tepidisphaeraceae bacterium]|jgi:SAM-dependent methyltransferase
MSVPLLDVRAEADFLAGHLQGAVSIPLEELPARTHELPAASAPLRVADADPTRAARAADFLRTRGHPVDLVPWEPLLAVEPGRSRSMLWRPNPFLVEALARIEPQATDRPSNARRAMDVACGNGRDAVYLAMQGYDVLAVDLLPDALERAADLARRCGVGLHTLAMDVERGPSLPAGPFDLVTVFRFLHRPFFPLLREAIAPGGYVICETFHERNLATGRRPQNAAHLLKTGELAEAFAGFEILTTRDAVEREERFFSSLLARKP